MSARDDYRSATARAAEQRRLFMVSASATKSRIMPGRLAQDMRSAIKTKVGNAAANATDHVRDRPLAFGAAGAALVLYLARRPIGSLLRRLYVRMRTGQWETDDG